MKKIDFKNLPDTTTPYKAQVFNEMQDNIEEAISYSTNEIQIGTWIDGKPLYRKVYNNFTLEAGTENDSIMLDIDINKNIKNSYGTIYVSSVSHSFEIGIGTGDTGFGNISKVIKNNGGQIYFSRTHDAWATLRAIEVVVEYTKATD